MYEPLISRRLPVARRRFVVAVSVLGAYGNGGGSDDGGFAASSEDLLSTEEAAQFELWSDFAQRLRENGMEGFPDPEVSEDGFMLIGAPLDPGEAEAWMAAQEACQHVAEQAQQNEAAASDSEWEQVVSGGDVDCTECTGG